jgi:hypothetical protein
MIWEIAYTDVQAGAVAVDARAIIEAMAPSTTPAAWPTKSCRPAGM